MKDVTNMFSIFIKDQNSEEVEPMSKLTRGLMYVYDMPYRASQICFVPLDSCRTGLTPEELKMCLEWREAYFDFHRYAGETSHESYYTEQELQAHQKERSRALTAMCKIEGELGEPQGRFSI